MFNNVVEVNRLPYQTVIETCNAGTATHSLLTQAFELYINIADLLLYVVYFPKVGI